MDLGDGALDVRGDQNAVLQRPGLGDDADQVATLDGSSHLDPRLKRPDPFPLQCRQCDPTREQRSSERVIAGAGEHL